MFAIADIIQIIFKIVLTLVFSGAVIYFSLSVLAGIWKADINFKGMNPVNYVRNQADKTTSFLPTIDPNAFYQNGKIVAEVSGAEIDKKNKTITFREIRSFSLDVDKPLDYRKYQLKCDKTTRSQKTLDKRITGYDAILGNTMFEIIGRRKEHY